MRDREVRLRDFPQGDGKVVRVTVSYHKGNLYQRGFWMHIQPMRLEVTDGVTFSVYNPVDGYRKLILAVNRYSPTRLAQATAMAEGQLETDDAVRTRIAYAAGSLADTAEV